MNKIIYSWKFLVVNMMLVLLLGSSTMLWANNNEKKATNDNEQSVRNRNYDTSTLHLTTASGVAIKVILDNKKADESNKATSVFESIQPGIYFLKVTEAMTLNRTSSNITTNSKDIVSEKIIFYKKIEIPARKVIYAFIDKEGNFVIARQRKVITI